MGLIDPSHFLSAHNCSIYILSLDSHVFIFFIIVDEIILTWDSDAQSPHFFDTFSSKFDMKDLHIIYYKNRGNDK